jgi:hypothetical protein
LREDPLPSAEIDAAGTAYLAWSDCRFRSGCPRNDIVLSKSTSETTWAAPTRVPIDATGSTVEHLVPGIGVDRSTSGGSARVGLTYYSYPNSACTAATCQLNVGFISSTNGGGSWSAATQIAGPMSLSWLPNTSQAGCSATTFHLGACRRQGVPGHPGSVRAERLDVQRRDERPDRRYAGHRRQRARRWHTGQRCAGRVGVVDTGHSELRSGVDAGWTRLSTRHRLDGTR